MKQIAKQFFRLLLFTVVYWVLVSCFFLLIRFYAIGQEQNITVDPMKYVSVLEWIDLGVYFGCFIGVFYTLIEFIFDKYLLKKLYLGLSILLRTFVYIVLLVSVLTLIMRIAEYRMDLDLPNEMGWWRTSPIFWISLAYFSACSLVFSFIKMAVEKFGSSTFFSMLIGKYRKPTEEQRIFMFLDLKDSTSIAENLGHFRYSSFIQDCFLDLNQVIEKYEAEVYQYVGDEAVLSWSYKKGIYRNNCVHLFFAFQHRIEKRKVYYREKYGVVPEFKAGLHGGKLIVVEVGSIKKELAYHGDVINTTARIQSECNSYGELLLISKALLKHLAIGQSYTTSDLGNLRLKGKQQSIQMYAIRKKDT